MSEFQILHNPRCSKSRQTLTLLNDNGIQPEVIEYLKNPPSAEEVADICEKLGLAPEALVRKKETLFTSLAPADRPSSDQQWLSLMAEHPKLIERPIVIRGQQARIGRPPERVLELL